ncbi:holo-ACP synthase, partial [Frankia sp. KB5]
MAVVGVGVDVVDVDRFAATLARTPGIAMRLFTATERGLAR